MNIIIGAICFALGALFGVFWMSAFFLAKQADYDAEKEFNNGD